MPQFSQFSTLANSGDQPPAAEHVSLENVPPPTHTPRTFCHPGGTEEQQLIFAATYYIHTLY